MMREVIMYSRKWQAFVGALRKSLSLSYHKYPTYNLNIVKLTSAVTAARNVIYWTYFDWPTGI